MLARPSLVLLTLLTRPTLANTTCAAKKVGLSVTSVGTRTARGRVLTSGARYFHVEIPRSPRPLQPPTFFSWNSAKFLRLPAQPA